MLEEQLLTDTTMSKVLFFSYCTLCTKLLHNWITCECNDWGFMNYEYSIFGLHESCQGSEF
jgi:hypothetical protein